MNIFNLKNKILYRGFTLIEILTAIAIISLISTITITNVNTSRRKSQDSKRISDIRQIRYALELYYDANGIYPTCLNPGGSCTTTLSGSIFMPQVPRDPLTDLNYSYAALGTGTNCSSYHLGTSLAIKTNPVLLSGADATPRTRCTGSANDFSGLSYAAAGRLCNTTAGIAQPTTNTRGESCYDVKP